MNSNSAFRIGDGHIVCEDYALSGGNNDIRYAIVCDGCTASTNVDFGARCIAFSAKEFITCGDIFKDIDFLRTWMGIRIISNAFSVVKLFEEMCGHVLDSTLMMAAISSKGIATVMLYGDGVVVTKKKAGVNIIKSELPSGAPDYLSYELDYFRKQEYISEFGFEKHITTMELADGKEAKSSITYPAFEPCIIRTDLEPGDHISIMSDGVCSYKNEDGNRCDWKDVALELSSYKSTKGEFVLRRMNAFDRKCRNRGWTHFDDISVASVIL